MGIQLLKKRRLLLLFWIVVGFLYFDLSYDYVHVSWNDRSLNDYLEHVVQLAGNEHRTPKEVRAMILVKAEELGVPVRGDQVEITGEGSTLKVSLDYETGIGFAGFQRVLYRKSFHHDARYHMLR
jgi:hypothetical protein